MSDSFKVSGKKFTPAKNDAAWTFEVRPGGWIIATGPGGERKRFAAAQSKGKAGAAIGGKLYHGEWITERKGGAAQAAGADSDLTAQFPGKVRKILVTPGAKIEAGAPMILVEAMKMEFTIKAPFNGIVKRVLVAEGQQLSPGDRFFDFAEEAPNGG